eukprot:scaffold889_cov379-Prasinococcus_capsulatus_cf.AAC.4
MLIVLMPRKNSLPRARVCIACRQSKAFPYAVMYISSYKIVQYRRPGEHVHRSQSSQTTVPSSAVASMVQAREKLPTTETPPSCLLLATFLSPSPSTTTLFPAAIAKQSLHVLHKLNEASKVGFFK